MPRPGIRLLGIVAALLLTGCTALNEAQAPLSTPTPSETAATSALTLPAWTENLVFSGDLGGQVTSVVPSAPGRQSECSGRGSATAGEWDSAIYGAIPAGVFGLIVTARPYRGPGIYSQAAATVQVHSTDNQRVWRSRGDDAVTFTVASDERSGSIDAVLTNQLDNTSKLHVTGTWSCGH